MKASKKRYKCEEAFLSELFVWIVVIHNEEEQNITIDGPDLVWKNTKYIYIREVSGKWKRFCDIVRVTQPNAGSSTVRRQHTTKGKTLNNKEKPINIRPYTQKHKITIIKCKTTGEKSHVQA